VLCLFLILNNLDFSSRVIPEGAQLSLNTYCIHRDGQYFHTPNAFLPERWFSKSKDVAPKLAAGEYNVAAFFPFSHGPTICAGKNLALCCVLRRFRFSRLPGFPYEEWEGRIQDWFVIRVDPLPVHVSVRDESNFCGHPIGFFLMSYSNPEGVLQRRL